MISNPPHRVGHLAVGLRDDPHELLPIMPPMVQLTWVEGLGPTIQPDAQPVVEAVEFDAGFHDRGADIVVHRHHPGAKFAQSITTPALQHCPARLPPPTDSNGTRCARQTSMAAAAASGVWAPRHRSAPLPVVGGVGGMGCTRTRIETDLPADLLSQAAASAAS